MYQQIIKQVSNLISLENNEMDYFLSKLEIKNILKKELLLKEGTVCRNAYFINSGCLRYYYTVAGIENTGQFFFENNWYTDYESFLQNRPSKQNIQALTDCEILCLSKTDLQQLYITVPKFERFGRLMAENSLIAIKNKNEMLLNQTAEERYLNLIKDRPKLFERIPQHYIASYLGIKPPSLSRIRKILAHKL
jgi:CRP/FNR family transcriptional regulator, anaerobic regulatory protein